MFEPKSKSGPMSKVCAAFFQFLIHFIHTLTDDVTTWIIQTRKDERSSIFLRCPNQKLMTLIDAFIFIFISLQRIGQFEFDAVRFAVA